MAQSYISRMYDPLDDSQTRRIIHPETEISAVLDPTTGKSLEDRLKEQEELTQPFNPDLGERAPDGLFSWELFDLFMKSISKLVVVGSTEPTFATIGIWENVYDTNMSIVDT